jgi:hypothetical protein
MKTFFPGPLPDHTRNILRRLGYAEQRTRSGQISYTKRASSNRFPRYHVYAEDRDQGMQVNLHVDQKEASYAGTSAHAGEYEGPLCEKEMHRITQFVQALKREPRPQPKQKSNDKSGFWGNLFG